MHYHDTDNVSGMMALRDGDLERAERLFKRAVAADKSDISPYMNLLLCYDAGKRSLDALKTISALRRNCNPVQLSACAAVLNGYEAAARKRLAGKRKVLLAVFSNSIESGLFAARFAESCEAAGDILLDLAVPDARDLPERAVRDLAHGSAFSLGAGAGAAIQLKNDCDAMVLVDLPKPELYGAFRGLLDVPGPDKIFVNLHLAPKKGTSPAADRAARERLFRGLRRMFILDNDTYTGNARYGTPAARMSKYLFSVDARHYAPAGRATGRYLVSAGNSARDYGALVTAAGGMRRELRIYTDLKVPLPETGAGKISVLPLAGNMKKLKGELGNALAVILPFRPEENRSPNSILTMAMALGKVVLTRRSAPLEKLVRDGYNGFFYDDCTDELKEKIGRILELSAAERRLIGARARKTVLARADYGVLIPAVLREIRPRAAL